MAVALPDTIGATNASVLCLGCPKRAQLTSGPSWLGKRLAILSYKLKD